MRFKNLVSNLSLQEWVMNNKDKEVKDQEKALRNYIISRRWLVIYDEYAKSKGVEKKDFDQWLQKKLKTENKGTKRIPLFITKMKEEQQEDKKTPPLSPKVIKEEKKKEETKPKINHK